MAYSYQQNMWDGAAEGYVKYNITPSFSTIMGYNDTFTISGQAYWRDAAVAEISVDIIDAIDGDLHAYGQIGLITKTIAKGKTGTFSMECTIPKWWVEKAAPFYTTNAYINGYISFSLLRADGSGVATVEKPAQHFQIIKERTPPQIYTIDGSPFIFSDNSSLTSLASNLENSPTNLYDYFKKYLQGASRPYITLKQFLLDNQDSKLTASHKVMVTDNLGNIVSTVEDTPLVQDTTASLELPLLPEAGSYNFSWRVMDSMGLSNYITGTFEVMEYFPPEIISFSLERYSKDLNNHSFLDDSGKNLWLTLKGKVAAVENKNKYTVTLTYNYNGETIILPLINKNDGDFFEYDRDANIFSGIVFDETENYAFTLTVQDMVNTITQTQTVYKSGGYFNIEKNGVAIGQRSTGFENTSAILDEATGDVLIPEAINKKFEVASDYASYFYGPMYAEGGASINGINTYPLLTPGTTETIEELTGGYWIDGKPIYRKVITDSIGTTESTLATVSNIDTVIGIRGSYRRTSDGMCQPTNYYYSSSTYNYVVIDSDGTVRARAGVAGTDIVIIEYTKTTD